MARRKKKTTKAVARDTVTLDSVFTSIANAIRSKTGGSDPISPRNMGNAIRAIKNVPAASLPAANLPAVFQDIADAIRAIGGSGTMTPVQMPSMLQGLGGHPETRVKYTNNTTDTFNISGALQYGDVTDIEDVAEIDIGNTVTSIYDYTFYQCYDLTSVAIPNSVTSIGEGTFQQCTGLTTVTIPASVATIYDYAFYNCSNCLLFDFTNHSTVPTLEGTNAFNSMNANAWIVVPDNLYSTWVTANNWSDSSIAPHIISATNYANIGNVPSETTFRFANGTSTTVNIQGELSTTILENLGLKSNYSTWISQPTSVEVGSNVTSIGHNAFYNCDALTTISLPDTVTSMGDRVFFDCDNFTTINIPSQMTSIGNETFKWCKVANITLPSSIATLGQNLFASCNTLTSVTFHGKTTAQVQGMSNYSWGIRSGCVITCSNGTITI